MQRYHFKSRVELYAAQASKSNWIEVYQTGLYGRRPQNWPKVFIMGASGKGTVAGFFYILYQSIKSSFLS